jgi:hypothetical protein
MENDFVGLGLSSRASSSINDAERLTCFFPALSEIDWPWRCSICYDQSPQSFLTLNVCSATMPGFQVMLNPLLALAAVSLAQSGPAPEVYAVPICSECRPFGLSDIVCTGEERETTLGMVAAASGWVSIAFASSNYGREFLQINEHLAFSEIEMLRNFKVKEKLKAAREERARKVKPAGWKIAEDRLLRILKEFDSVKSFFAKPDIPPAKLSVATMKCEVPPAETVVGLADLTFFGSAKRAMLFGLEGIYCKGLSKVQRFPYNEFPSYVFSVAKGAPAISAGEDRTLPFSSPSMLFALQRVLGKIKHEVIQ